MLPSFAATTRHHGQLLPPSFLLHVLRSSFRQLGLLCGGLLLTAPIAHAQTWLGAVTSPTSADYISRHIAPFAMVSDAAGNLYVTGTYHGAVTLGATTLVNRTRNEALFVAKRDPAGQWQWAVGATNDSSATTGLVGQSTGRGIALTAGGDVLLTGFYSRGVQFGPASLTANGILGANAYVAKLSAAGSWLWVASTSNVNNSGAAPAAITTDASGNIVVAGSCNGTLTFGATTLTIPPGVSNEVFVAKLNPAGQWLWATASSNSGGNPINGNYSRAEQLAVDGSGNIVVAGRYADRITMGNQTLTRAIPNSMEAYVAQLSPTGAWAGAEAIGSTGTSIVYDLLTDPAGDVLLAGSLTGSATFGTTSLTSAGSIGNGFVAKRSPAGAWRWVMSSGPAGSTTNWSNAYTLATTPTGTVVVSGSFSPLGATTANQLYVQQLSPTGTPGWLATDAVPAASSFAQGMEVAVDAPAGEVRLSGMWRGRFTLGTLAPLVSTDSLGIFTARLTNTPLATPALVAEAAPLTAWPSPAREVVMVSGAPGLVELLDALGRVVRTITMPAGEGELDLWGLPPGLYTVRAGKATRRLAVE